MVEPIYMMVGGIIGAVISLMWSDPFRDKKGQFTTRTRGFENWLLQAIIAAVIGAILTGIAVSFISNNPLVGIILLLGVSYLTYVKLVDPR